MRTAAASEKGSCKQEQTINTPIEKQSTQQKTNKSKSLTEFCENKPSIANDETAEHCPNTSSRSSDSDCGSSSSNELGCSVNVPADSTGLDAPQCDLGERALWHHSNTALEHKQIQTLSFYLYKLIPRDMALNFVEKKNLAQTSCASLELQGR